MILVVSSIGLGTVGYHFIASQEWGDALFKAALFQSGVAPVPGALLGSAWGRAFGWAYAVFAGVVLLFALGLVVAAFLRSDDAPTANGS